MTLDALDLPPITFVKARDYALGRSEPVRAFVNHRMVGYLAGTDAYYKAPDRPVSAHFGIGFGADKVVKLHQYVPLDDTAFTAGNYDPSGSWDDWGYKTTEVNAQIVGIEHQDHGDPAGKGVVSAATQLVSIKLQALLRYGDAVAWRAAGITIRDWQHNAAILERELHRIPIDGRHVIDHHDISGKLKPSCWRPWQKDTIGFPRSAYVAGIEHWGAVLVAPPAPPPDPAPAPCYTQVELDAAIAAAVSPVQHELDLANGRIHRAIVDLGGTPPP